MTSHTLKTDNTEDDSIRKFELKFLTLEFTKENKEFEKHFQIDFYNKSLDQVRFAIFLAVILYAFFGILEAALIPDFKYKFWTIRYLIVIPVLIGVLAFSFTKLYKRKIQFVSSSVVILSGFGVITMITLAPIELFNYYFPGLILILVMNYGFLKLRFVWAAPAGVIVSIVYVLGVFSFIKMPFLLSVMNSFFLIAINIIGMFISRNLERGTRKDYFSNQLLKIERFKLKTLNARLEAKIKDKANQLGNLQKEILDEIENSKKL